MRIIIESNDKELSLPQAINLLNHVHMAHDRIQNDSRIDISMWVEK